MTECEVRLYQLYFIITYNFRYSLNPRQSAFASEHESFTFYFLIFPTYYQSNLDSPVLVPDLRGSMPSSPRIDLAAFHGNQGHTRQKAIQRQRAL